MPTALDLSLEIPDRLLSELDRLQPDIPPTSKQPASVDDIFKGLMGLDDGISKSDYDQIDVNVTDCNESEAPRTVTQFEVFGPMQQIEMDPPVQALTIMAEDVSIGSENEIIPRQDIHLISNQLLQTQAKIDELSVNIQYRVQEVQTTLQMQLNEMQQRQQQFDDVLSAIRKQTIIITNSLMPASQSSSIRERVMTGYCRDTSTQTEDIQPNSLDGDQSHVRLNGKTKIESSQLNTRAVESKQGRTYESNVVTQSEVEINVDFDANGLVDRVVDNRHSKLILNRSTTNVADACDESSELCDTDDRCKFDFGIQEHSKRSESIQIGVCKSFEINLRKELNSSTEIHRTNPPQLLDEVEQDSTVRGSIPVQPECVNGEVPTAENLESDPDARVHEQMSVCTQSDDETVIVAFVDPLKELTPLEIPTVSDENSKRSEASALKRKKVPSSWKRKNVVGSSFSYRKNTANSLKESKTYNCEVCKKQCTSNSNLIIHLRIHTGEKPYKCQTCDASFTQKIHLTQHLRIHTGEKPYKCQTCNVCFSRKNSLAPHLRIHKGERPYKCQTCDACFSQKIHLTQHLRTHTGEKPFKCQTCKACFNRRSNLNRHLSIHNGEKPFECDICKKSFRMKKTLSLHMNIHRGSDSCQCNVCKKTFNKYSNLRRHLKLHV